MKLSRPHSARSSAFTLIELLTVVAIIAILAGLTLATSGYVQEKAGRSRAEAEVAALSAALESYKADNGDYPSEGTSGGRADGGANSSRVLIETLMPTNAGSKVYFEFDKRMTNGNLVVDPFGRAYRYQYPGEVDRSGTNFFDLWSFGKKGSTTATNDWVKNW